MIPYRVFKQDSDRVLHYEASSQALGEGVREVDLIRDGHQLRPGDVVELNGQWLFLLTEDEYVYLPAYADEDFRFGDGCWCLQMKARLQHEASVCEQMTQEAQSRARRRR
jgi:hypothetical protein